MLSFQDPLIIYDIRRLARRIDRGLTGASANPSGQPPAAAADQVLEYFSGQLDLIIDAGQTGLPSTIVDVSLEHPRLLRPGAVSPERLKAACPDLCL